MKGLAAWFILLWGWRRSLAAVLAGAFAVLTQAPFDFFAAGFVSFPILIWLMDGAVARAPGLVERLKPAFAVGWWFGFGYFLAGLWWVGGAMLVDADEYAWALPIPVIFLPAVLAVFYGGATALARLFWSDDIGRIAAVAASFALFEWLRTFVLTGFPWNPIGHAAMPVPLLMQSVAVAGMPGMNALAVFVFAMPALLAGGRHVGIGLSAAAALVAAHVLFGYARLAAPAAAGAAPVTFRIVQPSIDMALKLDREQRDEVFRILLGLSRSPVAEGQDRPQVIVWPETSIPFLLSERPDALVAIGEVLEEGQVLLAGAIRAEGEAPDARRFYNSVVVINDRGEIIDAVDKQHLVPGGEYLPLADLLRSLGVERIVPIPTAYSAGATGHPVRLGDGITAAVFICYEVIFPGEVDQAALDSNLIVNVTNDAWFGDTPGPYQHLRSAQIRAVETGKPLVRSANNGISAAIDGRGRIVDAFALDVRGALDVALSVGPASRAPLGSPDRNGFVIAALLALVAIGFGLRSRAGRK